MEKRAKKKKNKFSYFIIFLLFIVVGIGVGIFGTKEYLEYIKSNEEKPIIEESITDITDNDKYKDLINDLRGYINGNKLFYSTKGVVASSLDNTSRLNLIYDYIMKNKLFSSETLNADAYDLTTCFNSSFIVDVNNNTTLNSANVCTVNRITISLIEDINNQLFNDDLVDTSVGFTVGLDKKCVLSENDYLCGNITNVHGYTGDLESKFDVVQVTKDLDGTISIYEKGYLIDKRSNVDNPTDQYDNYYLHSSDSTDYYYELKSADNLTFKHIFKPLDDENYYYVSTELVKE